MLFNFLHLFYFARIEIVQLINFDPPFWVWALFLRIRLH